VLIGHVVARQPADLSGVAAGDVLAAWGGERLEGVDHFMGAVGRTQPGAVVAAEVRRHGRIVLDRFRAGSRPTDQGVLLPYDKLYVREDGSAVLPCRSGLDRLQPSPARRTPLWRDGKARGIVSHVVVRGALAYVAITYRLHMDRVVAVDLDAKREVWSAEVPGRVRHLVVTASALAVGFDGPDGVLVLDAFDGALRQEIAVTPPWVDDLRSTWVDRFAWDASLGNLLRSSATASGARFISSGTTRRRANVGIARRRWCSTVRDATPACRWGPSPRRPTDRTGSSS